MFENSFYEQNIEDRRHARYALVLYLPTELDEILAPHREKFDPLYNLVAAHVTIVFPFDSRWSLEDLSTMIEEELHNETEFSVTLSSIADFYPKSPVIYWKVLRSERLHGLYYRINGRLGLPIPFKEYVPHVTIAREISEHRVLFVKEKIVPYLPDESFVARSVDLITPLPGNRWVSVRTFGLKKP